MIVSEYAGSSGMRYAIDCVFQRRTLRSPDWGPDPAGLGTSSRRTAWFGTASDQTTSDVSVQYAPLMWRPCQSSERSTSHCG